MEYIVKADSEVAAETEVKAESQEEGQAYDDIPKIDCKFLYELMLVPQYVPNLRAEWISVEEGKLKVSLSKADQENQEAKAVEKVIKLVNNEFLKHGIQHFVAVLHETNSQERCCSVKNTHIHVIMECTEYDTAFVMQKNKNLSSRKFTTLLAQCKGTLGEKMSKLNWMLKTGYLNYPQKTLGLLKQRTCKLLGCSTVMQNYFDPIGPQEGMITKFRLPKRSHHDADSDIVELLKEKVDSLEKQVALLKFELSEKEAQISDLEYKNTTLEKDNYKNRDRELEDNQQEQSAEIQQVRKSLGDLDLKIEHLKEEE